LGRERKRGVVVLGTNGGRCENRQGCGVLSLEGEGWGGIGFWEEGGSEGNRKKGGWGMNRTRSLRNRRDFWEGKLVGGGGAAGIIASKDKEGAIEGGALVVRESLMRSVGKGKEKGERQMGGGG